MRNIVIAAMAAVSAMAVTAPAAATVIMPSASGLTFSAFSGDRGTLLASQTAPLVSGSPTFTANLVEAVYRNSAGLLDFYFQAFRTGGTDEIDGLDVSAYAGYTIDAQSDGTAFGPFSTVNNPRLADGTPSGSTTTVGRSNNGAVLRIAFGANGLTDSENSTTYIFRTNATSFLTTGAATLHDSQSANYSAFAPTGPAAVPETATWGMMILGVSAIGAALRRRRTAISFA